MKIESFRELLFKKAKGDSHLQSLIKYAKDEIIIDHILETLEKMAKAKHKGDAANFAVRDFATEMDPETEPSMIREALGHHVSHYKAALKQKRPDLANAHARQAFKIMNLADIAQKHSGGKLSIDHISPHPWERNKYVSQYDINHPKVQEGKYKGTGGWDEAKGKMGSATKGDFVTKTKGLNYKGTDFSHLQQAPHGSYESEVKRHKHLGAYPFEQIRVNGKYIPVDENVELPHGAIPKAHPFDEHPILHHFQDSAKDRSAEADQRYIQERDKYLNESPHVGKHFESQAALEAQDPEAFKQRGSVAGAPVHDPVEPLKISERAGSTPGAAPEAAAPEEAGGESPFVMPAAKPKAAQEMPDISKLPPELQAKVLALIRGDK